MLLLFDIDGTLLDTGGAGLRALQQAAREHFDAPAPPLDLAGSTDSGLLRSLYEHFECPFVPTESPIFYERYLRHLGNTLTESTPPPGRVLPGVPHLLARLRDEGHVLGLLTGNIAAGAMLKLQHFELAEFFAFGAFGDDHHDRNELGPVALRRAEQHTGHPFSPQETLIIGDTPKDIRCARALGAPVLAVATGIFSESELEPFAPDHLLPDLEAPFPSLAAGSF